MKEMKVEILTIGAKKDKEYGECNVFLLFADGKLEYSVVIDSCEEDLDILTKKVIDKYNIKHFDIICWTHPHADHSKGMLKLLQEYCNKNTKIVYPSGLGDVENCLISKCKEIYKCITLKSCRRQTNHGEIKEASESKTIDKNYFDGKDLKLEIKSLAPISQRIKTEKLNCNYVEGTKCYHKYNEFSVVLLMRLNRFRFLFNADATNGTIEYFKTTGRNNKFNNILFSKIPHHGSLEANALLKKFNTDTCKNMICVTTAFRVGNVILPNKKVLDEYSKLGKVYCTSNLYSENKETYGIVKSIFEFDYDDKKELKLKNVICTTEGSAYLYKR